MKKLLTILVALSAFAVFPTFADEPVLLIVDTDFAPDCDDVGALAVAHYLENTGEAELIGVITSTTGEYVVAAVDAVNHYYGRLHIPIGLSVVEKDQVGGYTPALADTNQFPSRETNETAYDSTTLYRKLLHDAERPVRIVVIGYQSPLSAFLDSEANHGGDGIPYTGLELAEQKVEKLVLMVGNFENPNHFEWNLANDVPAAQNIVDNWPGEIIFSGYEIGNRIRTGEALKYPDINPVAMAYKLYGGAGGVGTVGDRQSWDQAAVLQAVRGNYSEGQRLWELSDPGITSFSDSEPYTEFTVHPDGQHRYQVEDMDPNDVADIIEAMMIAPPVLNNDPSHYRVAVKSSLPVAGSNVDVTAQLEDENGKPVFESRAVSWSATNGGSFSSSQTSTDGFGRVTVTFTVSSEENVEHVVTATDDADSLITGSSPAMTTRGADARLIAYYPFNEGGGNTVGDQSNVGEPLDLEIFGGAQWVAGENAILLDGSTGYLKSRNSAEKLYDLIPLSGKFTVEAWIAPARSSQGGPARIVSYSEDPGSRNFTLGHGHWTEANNDIAFRLRTTETDSNGMPQIDVEGVLSTELQHVVATYDGSMLRIYRNGSEIAAEQRNGALDNWNSGFSLVLGSEASLVSYWAGAFHEVAIYDRDLSASEVADRFKEMPRQSD